MMRVYILIDPLDNIVKYVGITKNTIEHRLSTHIKDSKTKFRKGGYLSHKEKWILELASQQLKPHILCMCDNLTKDEAVTVEKNLISIYKREYEGGTLKNVQEGGFYTSDLNHVWNKGLTGCCKNIESMSKNQPNRKVVFRFDKNGILIDEWYSTRHMCDVLKFDRRTVMRCLRKEENFLSHKGFMFSYTKEPPIYMNKSTKLYKMQIQND